MEELQALRAVKSVLGNSRSQPSIRGFQCVVGPCLSVQCHLSLRDLHGDMNITLAQDCFFLPRSGRTVCLLGGEGQLHNCWVLVLMAVGNLLWMPG